MSAAASMRPTAISALARTSSGVIRSRNQFSSCIKFKVGPGIGLTNGKARILDNIRLGRHHRA